MAQSQEEGAHSRDVVGRTTASAEAMQSSRRPPRWTLDSTPQRPQRIAHTRSSELSRTPGRPDRSYSSLAARPSDP
jgi:hypothetical protein